uniref:PlsC domain-containing protein n=1 Tax=Trichuris muris TaxID=70415 RepID=A0A5S6QA88_TRIMR
MVDDMLYSIYQRFLLFFFENFSAVELILYCSSSFAQAEAGEKAICICNHQSSFDWAVFDMLAIRQNRLGSLRYVLKDSLQYLPLYGWYFFAHGGVYVRRGSAFKQARAIRQLQYLRSLDQTTSLVLFPEGTRFHPSKTRDIAKSRQLAIEAGVTPPEKTLLPRFRGMHLTVDTLGDTFDAVYDVTIVYERAGQQGEQALLAPGLYDVLCGPAYYKVHAHVDRIPMSVVPREEQSLQRWLYDRFSIKDRAFRNFLTDGRPFAEEPIACKRVSFADTLPSALLLSAATIALLCTAKGRRLFVRVWALGSLACLVSSRARFPKTEESPSSATLLHSSSLYAQLPRLHPFMEETKLFYTAVAAAVVCTLLLALMICLCCRRFRRGHSYEPAVAQLVTNPNSGRPAKEFYV